MSWLRDAFAYLAGLVRRRPRPLRAKLVEDLPDALAAGTIYLVGEDGHLWSVAFLCPCGCEEPIHLNVLPDARPRWRVRRHRDGGVTLTPSVWRKTGCRSHFFLRRGVVQWVPELCEANLRRY